jgi:hypothetical protein
MRQEFQKQEGLNELPTTPTFSRSAAEELAARRATIQREAHSYLARFAPLLYALQTDDPAECERALQTVIELRAGGERLRDELEITAEPSNLADNELLATFRTAYTQAESIEEALRRRLALLRPGSPEGRVDLAALRAGLAQVAAKRELAEATGTQYEEEARVEMPLSKPNYAAGAGQALAGLGIGAFITIHATLFIGGFSRVIGGFALFFLLFYALFYAAVFSLFANAVSAASEEDLTIEGDELVIHSKTGPFTREKRYRLGRNSRAALVTANLRAKGTNPQEIAMVDADGREFRFGRHVPDPVKRPTVDRINRYIQRVVR